MLWYLLATVKLLKYSNKTIPEQGWDIIQVKITLAITLVRETTNFRPMEKKDYSTQFYLLHLAQAFLTSGISTDMVYDSLDSECEQCVS